MLLEVIYSMETSSLLMNHEWLVNFRNHWKRNTHEWLMMKRTSNNEAYVDRLLSAARTCAVEARSTLRNRSDRIERQLFEWSCKWPAMKTSTSRLETWDTAEKYSTQGYTEGSIRWLDYTYSTSRKLLLYTRRETSLKITSWMRKSGR